MNKPQYLNLNQLEQSVKKINDLVDISINNFNKSFNIDNFEPVSILRNTNLRTEFNTLCKGKQESRNLNEQDNKENDKKIFLCKEEQIRDIPPLLHSLFDKVNKYYIYGTPSNYSFYHSILLIINSEFILQGKLSKEQIIDESRSKLVFDLDQNYVKFEYKKKRYTKSTIRENLLNSKVFLPQVNAYIADFYDVCLLIIDTETYLYSLINDYDKNKKFVIMLRKNNYYQPILNSEGNNLFDCDIVDKINKILKPEFDIDFNIKEKKILKEKEELENTNTLENATIDKNYVLLKETKYKLNELHIISKKLSIDIKILGTNRNKKKSDLYMEISDKINSL